VKPTASLAAPSHVVQGDSGGPIVLPSLSGDVVVGVTSWGPADCRTPYSFYTRIADHLPWLKAKMALPITAGAGTGAGLTSGSSSSSSGSSSSSAAASEPSLADVLGDLLGLLPASR